MFSKKRKKRMIGLFAAALVIVIVTGCTPATGDGGGDTTALGQASAAPGEGQAEVERRYIDGSWYPIVDEPITITWFYNLDPKSAVTMTSYSQIRAYQYVMELTNINIDFHHPPVGQFTEVFNLMMASADLTDIVSANFRTGFVGGATRALEEGLLLPLNDLMEEHAPNIWNFYQERPHLARLAKTDDGIFYGFHTGNYELVNFNGGVTPPPAFFTFGWQIRQDWLDQLGLDVPETISEWGYNWDTFTVVDGEVRFGPARPEYLEFLTVMNRWYEAGLIEPDYVTFDGPQFDSRVMNDQAGAWTGATSGTLGRLVQLLALRDSPARLTGTVQPYIDGGRPFNFDGAAHFLIGGLAHTVSARTNFPVEVVRLLDFGYGPYGHRLLNWGFEGESFWVDDDGVYWFTDYITHNPNGLALDDALMPFAPGGNDGPMFLSFTKWNRRMWMPEQREAVARWSVGSHERIMPPVSFTPDESSEVAAIMSRVNTHRDEMLHRFIMGLTPLTQFDDYIATLEGFGLNEAIEIHQRAYERFLLR